MPEPITRPTKERVTAFLKRATEGDRRKDATTLVRMLTKASGSRGVMWGRSIVGFGRRDIAYADGHTSDWPIIAFAPRKQDLTIYINRRLDGLGALRRALGRHTLSGGCLHIKRLSDVDLGVLAKVLARSVKQTRKIRAYR